MSKSKEGPDTAEAGEQLARSLKKVISEVKTRNADRDDVVVELKESEAVRLELLADELRPLFEEIDETDERFDIGLTRGERPRLWIDMTSFVAMGQDKRNYRFIKDTRMGRLVLAETIEMSKMADIVSDYVAERVLEREKMIEGEWLSLKGKPETSGMVAALDPASQPKTKRSRWRSFFWFLFGIVFTVGALIAAAFVLVPDAF